MGCLDRLNTNTSDHVYPSKSAAIFVVSLEDLVCSLTFMHRLEKECDLVDG